MIRIVIADDHPLVRQGLRAVLESADWRVIGEASDGVETLDVVKEHRPDVLIVDVVMPRLNGLEVTRQVAHEGMADTRVIVLSMYDAEPYVLEAVRAEASGFVIKGAAGEVIVDAVRAAMAGRFYVSPPLDVAESYVQKAREGGSAPYEALTTREREVIQMVAEGQTNRTIGENLGISHRTVEIHRANAMHKLGLTSWTDLARFALQQGIVAPETEVNDSL